MWKKIFFFYTALLLAGCSSLAPAPSQLDAPTKIQHQNKDYELVGQADLGSMARYFYVAPPDSLENWNSALELMLDRNAEKRSLKQRLELRKGVFSRTKVASFDLYLKQDFLYAFVIYAPNAQQDNWQIDVAKGKDLAQCGFVQYQYSIKIEKNRQIRQMSKAKLLNYLKKYVAGKELKQLEQSPWTWSCLNPK